MTFKAHKIKPIRDNWRNEPRNTHKKKPTKIWQRLLVLVIFLAIIIGLFTYVLPIAEVTIVPTTTTNTQDLKIKLDSQAKKWDPDNQTLPASIMTQEKNSQATFEATGEKDMGDKASGQATFYNQTGLTQPITANTQLRGPGGQIFLPTTTFVIPQATVSPQGDIIQGEISIQIEAQEPGEDGNLESGKLTIIDLTPDRQNKIYGQIQAPLTGGTSDIVKVVSQEDIDLATEQLSDQLKINIIDEIVSSLGKQQKMDEKLITWQVLSAEKSVELDKETEEFDMRIVLQGKALIYDHSQLEQIIKNKIINDLGPQSKIVDSTNNKIELSVDQAAEDNTWADVAFHAEYQIAQEVDLDQLKTLIAGKKRSEARRLLLQNKDIRDVRFNFKYSLLNSIPTHTNRVKILLKS